MRLDGTAWTIVSAQGRPLPVGDDAIWFSEAIVFGSAGCNSFSTAVGYEPATGAVAFGRAMRMTKKACPGPEGVFEQSFVQALVGARTASLDPSGRLILEGTGGPIVLSPTDRPRPTD